MCNRRSERNMPHALAPDPRKGDLNAAFLANDPFIFHPLIFAAQALIVLNRAENPGAKESVPLGLERAVIDRLRLLDLAKRPRQYLFRTSDGNLDLIERLRLDCRAEKIHDLLIHRLLLILGRAY